MRRETFEEAISKALVKYRVFNEMPKTVNVSEEDHAVLSFLAALEDSSQRQVLKEALDLLLGKYELKYEQVVKALWKAKKDSKLKKKSVEEIVEMMCKGYVPRADFDEETMLEIVKLARERCDKEGKEGRW